MEGEGEAQLDCCCTRALLGHVQLDRLLATQEGCVGCQVHLALQRRMFWVGESTGAGLNFEGIFLQSQRCHLCK